MPARTSPWANVRSMFAPEPQPPQTVSTRMTVAINSMRGSNSSSAATQQMENVASAAGVLPAADSMCPNLTFKQRLWGCIYCSGSGMALSFLGYMLWWTGHVAGFAVIYTIGNIVSICGSGFLFGPKRQCRSMFAARRREATCIYFAAMLLTLIVALSGGPKPIVLLLIFIQW